MVVKERRALPPAAHPLVAYQARVLRQLDKARAARAADGTAAAGAGGSLTSLALNYRAASGAVSPRAASCAVASAPDTGVALSPRPSARSPHVSRWDVVRRHLTPEAKQELAKLRQSKALKQWDDAVRSDASRLIQGLTLVHFSAHPKPFLSLNTSP